MELEKHCLRWFHVAKMYFLFDDVGFGRPAVPNCPLHAKDGYSQEEFSIYLLPFHCDFIMHEQLDCDTSFVLHFAFIKNQSSAYFVNPRGSLLPLMHVCRSH